MYLNPERYFLLLEQARNYQVLMRFGVDILVIVGLVFLVVCILWAVVAIKLFARNHFLEERSQILMGLLVKHGEDRDNLERMMGFQIEKKHWKGEVLK